MMSAIARYRATLAFIALFALAAFTTSGAWAQDPRNSEVQKIARDWLALADKDDGAASWKAAGKKFQDAMTMEQWTGALIEVHRPIGKTMQRAVTGTSYDKSFPGAPEGEYATIEFRTSFANRVDGRETVTLERENVGGSWRVIGYSIH